MTAAVDGDNTLNSMAASVGAGIQGDKAAFMLSRLASRDAQRKAQAEQQAATERATAAPSESAKAFLTKLDTWQNHTQQVLDDAANLPAQDSTAKEQLEQLSVSLLDMEQAAAQASYFLTAYDSRQTATTISALREQIDTAKKQQVGKKKFGFSKRSKQPATCRPASIKQAMPDTAEAHDKGLLHNTPPIRLRGLADLQHQDIVKNADELAGGEYNLTNLQSCTIQLQGPMSSLHLRNLTECTVEAGPVSGPVFVHGAMKCCLRLASHQIRIHDAHECTVTLRLRSNPIIEHSDGLQFGSYHPTYQGSMKLMESAGLGQENGLWQQVQDFGWLRKTQSPHWSVMTNTA